MDSTVEANQTAGYSFWMYGIVWRHRDSARPAAHGPMDKRSNLGKDMSRGILLCCTRSYGTCPKRAKGPAAVGDAPMPACIRARGAACVSACVRSVNTDCLSSWSVAAWQSA